MRDIFRCRQRGCNLHVVAGEEPTIFGDQRTCMEMIVLLFVPVVMNINEGNEYV